VGSTSPKTPRARVRPSAWQNAGNTGYVHFAGTACGMPCTNRAFPAFCPSNEVYCSRSSPRSPDPRRAAPASHRWGAMRRHGSANQLPRRELAGEARCSPGLRPFGSRGRRQAGPVPGATGWPQLHRFWLCQARSSRCAGCGKESCEKSARISCHASGFVSSMDVFGTSRGGEALAPGGSVWGAGV
jgi:hypothetical protein